MSQPILTIVAGSNGCGKSTLTASSKDKFQISPVLDPDAIAKSIEGTVAGDSSNIEAGKRVLRAAEKLLADRQSFTGETTLSGGTYLKMAQRAKAAGYILMVVFVGTRSVEINIERVKARVILGGHDVPEEDQRRRYPRTLKNMKRLLPFADLAVIFDNSEESHKMIAFGHRGFMHWKDPLPEWAAGLRG